MVVGSARTADGFGAGQGAREPSLCPQVAVVAKTSREARRRARRKDERARDSVTAPVVREEEPGWPRERTGGRKNGEDGAGKGGG